MRRCSKCGSYNITIHYDLRIGNIPEWVECNKCGHNWSYRWRKIKEILEDGP